MISRRYALLGAAAAAALAGLSPNSPSRAHDKDSGPNGGPMLEVNDHHLELTSTGTALTLYLMDSAHAPVSSKGISGRVVILEGSQQATHTLEVTEPNKLSAKLDKPLGAGARVVVTARLTDGRNLTARFVWK